MITKNNLMSFTINYHPKFDSDEVRGVDVEPRPWNLLETIICYSDKSKKMLDVGCGTGYKLVSLLPYFKEIVAVDCNDAMLKVARNHSSFKGKENIKFLKRNAYDLNLESGYFDLVTAMLSRWTVSELHRILKADGIVIIASVGCRDKFDFKKYFGCNDDGLPRGQYLEFDSNTYINDIKNAFKEYFDVIIIKNGFWKTAYSREGIINLMRYTPTIKNYDENKDKSNLNLALKKLAAKNSPGKIILEQNRILIIAKKKKVINKYPVSKQKSIPGQWLST